MQIRFYEDDIKDMILRKKRLFVPEGMESVVLFEKALVPSKAKGISKSIADCLIFREDGIIIGIEIKTERDELSRLRSQLPGYSIVCDYVYVMCHDDHIEKVEQSTARYKQRHVGIIAYREFKSVPFSGVYREAELSPTRSAYSAFNLLWKAELLAIHSGFSRPGERAEEELGVKNYRQAKRGYGVSDLASRGTNGRSMTKGMIIKNLLAMVGEDEAKKILCDVFIRGRIHPERSIRLRHFFPSRIHNKEEEDG